jgi:hypothetical protein
LVLSQGTLLEKAVIKNNWEDACLASLSSREEVWELKLGDGRRGEEVDTDEKNSEVGT